MKQKLLVLALGVLLASCSNGGGDTAALQKKVDSMTTLLGSTMNASERVRMTIADGLIPPPRMITQEPKESYYISWWQGRDDIQRWQNYIWDKSHGLIEDTARCSFIIPATNLRYLVDTMNLEYVVFYLSLDSAKMLSLVYEGGNLQIGDNGSDTVLMEQPVYRKAGTNYAFNHAYPCPVCDKIGLTNPNGQ
ncbi:MAG: hypothetical protein KF744_09900 [Taibaiella sp.]|nr:hypothetical protein [Taibaiella sp.]